MGYLGLRLVGPISSLLPREPMQWKMGSTMLLATDYIPSRLQIV